ncbi:MAG: GntR family transcriptional regulator [Verrucomicrobiaceae bacterium]|nr:MAG: GntR family transcriptional regulator [Verrucomicrobiaceae bacterium]
MPDSIERITLATKVADTIEAELRTGTWQSFLPGIRSLAERYGVNHKTSQHALTILEKRGIVGPGEPGKRRPVIALPAGRGSGPSGKRFLIVIPESPTASYEDSELLRTFIHVWEQVHGDVSVEKVDYLRHKNPGKLLASMVERHAADAMLLQMPTRQWSAAAAHVLPTYQLGGGFLPSDPLTLSAYSINDEIARTLARLRAMGHEKILIPLGLSDQRMRDSVHSSLMENAANRPPTGTWLDYCPWISENSPEVWRNFWPMIFAKVSPTAVILLDSAHLLSLYGHCAASRIRIPRDLSVVLLSWEPLFQWCDPVPDMLRYPVRSSVSHFKSWLAGGMKPLGLKTLPLEMLDGESVSKPGSNGAGER